MSYRIVQLGIDDFRYTAMTFPKCFSDNHDVETQSTSAQDVTLSDALQYDLPAGILDRELFEDMHSFLGNADMRASLTDLSSSLQEGLPDISAQPKDREGIFLYAHTIGSRAGMLGFLALRDACWKLQHAVSTGENITPAYGMAQDAGRATCAAIAILHQRLL